MGFFSPLTWIRGEGDRIHEISLIPDNLLRNDLEWHATLVHEMAHLWQFDHGQYPSKGYHDKQWGDKMEEIGLIPSHTGQPGGRKQDKKCQTILIQKENLLNTSNVLTKMVSKALKSHSKQLDPLNFPRRTR